MHNPIKIIPSIIYPSNRFEKPFYLSISFILWFTPIFPNWTQFSQITQFSFIVFTLNGLFFCKLLSKNFFFLPLFFSIQFYSHLIHRLNDTLLLLVGQDRLFEKYIYLRNWSGFELRKRNEFKLKIKYA